MSSQKGAILTQSNHKSMWPEEASASCLNRGRGEVAHFMPVGGKSLRQQKGKHTRSFHPDVLTNTFSHLTL
jgi:hypothetical protein